MTRDAARTVAALLTIAALGVIPVLPLVVGGEDRAATTPHVSVLPLPAGPIVVPVTSPAPVRASRQKLTTANRGVVLNGRSTPAAPASSVSPRRPTTQDVDIATVVADCESGDRLANGRARYGSYDLRAENSHSSASGKFQFISSTWTAVTGKPAPASAYPENVQDAAFRELWAGGRGASHWAASRSCWGWTQ